MMYFLLILFFGSLFGIAFLIGRKLLVLQDGQFFQDEEIYLSGAKHLEEWKNSILQGIKTYSYQGLVGIIRLYVRSANFLQKKYQDLKTKLQERHERRLRKDGKMEVSGFLKMISEYKGKIRRIKRQITEEEEESL